MQETAAATTASAPFLKYLVGLVLSLCGGILWFTRRLIIGYDKNIAALQLDQTKSLEKLGDFEKNRVTKGDLELMRADMRESFNQINTSISEGLKTVHGRIDEVLLNNLK